MNRQETYGLVIDAEIRAQKLYQSLAKSFRNPETSRVFQELVNLEKMHEEKLREAYKKEFPNVELVLVIPPEHEIKGVELNEPLKVLEFAISREDIARDAYLKMAELSNDQEIKNLLLDFAAQEDEHKQVIQAEIQRLQGVMIWYDPSELNGLMED